MSLPDLLDDLARSQPVHPPDLAGRAWRDGRRRRSGSRLRLLAAVATVLAVLALVLPLGAVPAAAPFAAGGGTSVDGYPERIGRQWWVRGLPDRPGPVAALLQAVDERDSHDDPDGWYAVRADGHRWRLPEVSHRTDLWPALSDDGRLLGHLEAVGGPYVVRDLVTGHRVEFDGVVEPAGQDLERGILYGQSPAFFSPSGDHLLLPGGAAVLDLARGTVERLPEGIGNPAGWRDDERIVWLRATFPPDPPGDVRALTTDREGRVLADVRLPGTATPDYSVLGGVSQWSGSLSPDGQQLAVTTSDGVTGSVRRFFVDSGEPAVEAVAVDVYTPCQATWDDAVPVVPVLPPDGAVIAEDVLVAQTRPRTVAAPSIGARCLVWAQDALVGPAHGGGLLGRTEAGWSWWWRELVAGAVGAVAAAVLAGRRLRRWYTAPTTGRPAAQEQGDRSWFD